MGNCFSIPICGCVRDDTRSQTPDFVLQRAEERSATPRTSDAPKSSNMLLSPKEHQNLDERKANIKHEIEKELKIKQGGETLRKVLKDQKHLLSLEEIMAKADRKLEDLYTCLQELENANFTPDEKDLPEEPPTGGSDVSVYETAASLSVEKTESEDQLMTACENLVSEVDPDKVASSAPDVDIYLTAVEYAEKPLSEDPEKDVYYTIVSSSSSTSSSSVVDVQNMELAVSESAQQQPLLSLENFQWCKELGRGSFGKVLLARQKNSNRLVAVKALKKAQLLEQRRFERLMYEKEIFQTVSIEKYPFLVNLISSFQSKDHVFFVMEYAPGGSLKTNFCNAIGGFTEAQAVFYSACVVLGLDYLHLHKIMHRDLKLENIVLDQRGYAKITDFGLSKPGMGYADRTYSFCGSRAYMAPEILLRRPYTRAVDWWSVGIIIFELLVGKRPFQGKNNEELGINIMCNEVDFPSTLSQQAVYLLGCLLEKNPSWRLGAQRGGSRQVREHVFFREINWAQLYQRITIPPIVPTGEEGTSNTGVILTTQWTSLTQEQQEAFIDFEWMAEGTP